MNADCRAEAEAITEAYATNGSAMVFLTRGRPDDPKVPEGSYSMLLAEESIGDIVDYVRRSILDNQDGGARA